MRSASKSRLLLVVGLLVSTVLLVQCKDTDENQPTDLFTPENQAQLKSSNSNSNSSSFVLQWQDSQLDCTAPGFDCAPEATVELELIEEFDGFLRDGGLSTYFLNSDNKFEMFPALRNHEKFLNLIIEEIVTCIVVDKGDEIIYKFVKLDSDSGNEEVVFVCQVIPS